MAASLMRGYLALPHVREPKRSLAEFERYLIVPSIWLRERDRKGGERLGMFLAVVSKK